MRAAEHSRWHATVTLLLFASAFHATGHGRRRFEELNAGLFKKTMGPVKTVLEDADLKKDQVRKSSPFGGRARRVGPQDCFATR